MLTNPGWGKGWKGAGTDTAADFPQNWDSELAFPSTPQETLPTDTQH